jgi:hypothetical protein
MSKHFCVDKIKMRCNIFAQVTTLLMSGTGKNTEGDGSSHPAKRARYGLGPILASPYRRAPVAKKATDHYMVRGFSFMLLQGLELFYVDK